MAVVGGILFIIGLCCEVSLVVGGTGFWTWFFALGTEIVTLFCVTALSESIDSDSALQKVLNVIGTVFWLIALWLGYTDAEGPAKVLICLAGIFIAPYLIVISLDAFFVDSGLALVFIGIAKFASSLLLYTADLKSLGNTSAEIPGKLVAYVAIISFFVLLFWIMAISRKIIANNKENHERRKREEEQRKLSCSKRLIFEAGKNDRNAVLDMLEQGADVNYQDSYGDTPLSAAVTSGNVDMTVLLLEKGADIECKSKNGCTPLQLAINGENKEIVSLLIEKGANIECETENGTPLQLAVTGKNKEIVSLLIEKGANIEHETEDGFPPLQLAVGDKEIVSLLIEKGANIEHESRNGFTPLQHSIMKENKEVLSLLIERGANIEHEAEDGITPLINAILKKNKEMVSTLLEKGVDIDHESKNGLTPLRFAIAANDKEIVSLLIEKGADVNLESPYDGHTPLSIAVAQNNKDVVSLLLKNGADSNKKDREEGSPLMIAFSKGYKEICSLLMENGANSDEILWLAAVMQSTEVMQFFLDRGADVNCENSDGLTPLKCAILTNYKEMVLLLISYGADVNFERSRPSEKNAARTPLESAIITGNTEMVSLLITYGADVNYKTKNGNTPLLFAALHGKSEIVPLLKEAGAVSNAAGKNAQTTAAVATSSASSDLQDDSVAFNAALVALSKIIAKNGAEIFAPENSQKLKALVSDLIPQEHEIAAKLRQSLSCDFAQIMLDATDKSDDKKEMSFGKAVDTIIAETGLEKEAAVSMVKLVALALDWDLESVTVQ